MENNFVQESLSGFYQEIMQIVLPENAITLAAKDLVPVASKQVEPFIKTRPPRVDTDVFFNVLYKVAEIIKKNHSDKAAEIIKIESVLPINPVEQKAFVTLVFTPGVNLLANLPQNLPADTLGLLLNHTVKMFMRQYVEKVLPYADLDNWYKGNCPVCGGSPSFALLRKEGGGRYLYCGLCEIKWRFQRLGCPFCSGHGSQFITLEGIEEIEKYRIYLCEDCQGYIKTIDESKVEEEVDLFWEDINTIDLDLLAISEGYFNKQLAPPPQNP